MDHGRKRNRMNGRVYLLKLADLIEENAEEFSHLETLDNGMQLNSSFNQILGGAEDFRYYAGWATKITGEAHPQCQRLEKYI